MGRKRKPPTVTVRLDKELAKRLRWLAYANNEDVSDYVARLLKPIVEKETKRVVARELKDSAEGKE
jgi:predicted transcriptional regulator